MYPINPVDRRNGPGKSIPQLFFVFVFLFAAVVVALPVYAAVLLLVGWLFTNQGVGDGGVASHKLSPFFSLLFPAAREIVSPIFISLSFSIKASCCVRLCDKRKSRPASSS